MSGKKRKSSCITATAKVGDSSSSGSENEAPIIHRFTYKKKLSGLEPIGKSKDRREEPVNSAATQEIDDENNYDQCEDENSDGSNSPSNGNNSEHISSSNIREADHDDHRHHNDISHGEQNGNKNSQAGMKKLDVMKLPDGSCVVACLPDENLQAYSKLQNANCNQVYVPLSCNELKIMNWKKVPGLEMYPGVKAYKTVHVKNCVIQKLKIDPRTVKPMETLDRYNAVITAMKGHVVLKVLSFTLTKSGKPALKRFHLQEGAETCINIGSAYSIENWNDTQVVVMLCLISEDD